MKTRTINNISLLIEGILVLVPALTLAAEPPAIWVEGGKAHPLVIADSTKKYERDVARPVGTERLLVDTSTPIYNPPRLGTAASTLRVGGGSRGNAGIQPTISALAPNGDGTTIHDQPTLYWYTSRPLAAPVLFTLIEMDAVAPTAVVRLATPSEPGIHPIRFAELGIRLAPGTTYHWSVAVVTDAARRSHDMVATGAIEYVPGETAMSDPSRNYRAYAQEGLWYDAMAALSDRLNTDPSHEILQLHRAVLLDAVGLGFVAEYDRHPGP